MPKDAIGSKTQRITEGKSARKPRTRCSFNDEGVLVLLKYINSHLDDFRNDHWKAYKACTEIMLRDPRTEKRYTDRHLSNKVTHILHENMKDGFSARGKRNWLLFTYGTQILDLQDSLWHNKANGIVLSGQLESSLPRTAPDPYDSISNNVVSSGACAGSRKALVVASHRFEPRVQDPGRQAAQKGTNKLREDSLKSTASTQEDGRHCIVVPPPLISGHREGQQQIQKDSVLALLTEQIEVGLFFTGAQEPILRYKLPSVRGAQDNNQQRSFDEEILEPQRKQITYPSAEATNTISIQAPAPSADVDQHAVGHLRILRPPPLWKAFGSDSSSHKNPNLLNDWTDYGLKKTMGDIFGEINATVVAFSCNAEIDLIPGPGYQNLDKEYPDLVRLYKMVFGDHDNGPFGEIIADKAIKAMTRKDWLKALIAAAVTMQVLQADVPEDCYEQNTFLKMMDTVLSVNPSQFYDPLLITNVTADRFLC